MDSACSDMFDLARMLHEHNFPVRLRACTGDNPPDDGRFFVISVTTDEMEVVFNYRTPAYLASITFDGAKVNRLDVGKVLARMVTHRATF